MHLPLVADWRHPLPPVVADLLLPLPPHGHALPPHELALLAEWHLPVQHPNLLEVVRSLHSYVRCFLQSVLERQPTIPQVAECSSVPVPVPLQELYCVPLACVWPALPLALLPPEHELLRPEHELLHQHAMLDWRYLLVLRVLEALLGSHGRLQDH